MLVQEERKGIVSNLQQYNNLVGFDLDGTLNDLAAYQIPLAQKFFRREANDLEAYDIEDMYKCSHFIRQLFWARYIWHYCMSYPARDDAKKVLKRIRALSLTPCMITARVYVTDNGLMGKVFRSMVYHWDQEQGINIGKDKIIFCSEKKSAIEKARYCKELGVRWMFEDKPDNVWAISQVGTHVLCPRTPYNKMISSSDKVTVIETLMDGLEFIEDSLNQENQLKKGGYQYVKKSAISI